MALQFRIGDIAAIAADAETFAKAQKSDPHWSHDLWELAARAHNSLGNQEERDRCLIESAESHVGLAEAAGGEGSLASSAIMDAIQVLRRIPNTGQRRHELQEKLRYAQASVHDEMGTISQSFDLTEYIEHARRSVRRQSWHLLILLVRPSQTNCARMRET